MIDGKIGIAIPVEECKFPFSNRDKTIEFISNFFGNEFEVSFVHYDDNEFCLQLLKKENKELEEKN